MISRINPPIRPSTPSENPADVASIAQSFGRELDELTATLSTVDLKNLEAQLPNIAQRLAAVSEQAKKALSLGRS